MKITRRGSFADHGPSSIAIDDPLLTWNKLVNTLDVKKEVVNDFNTSSTHDYTVTITLDEFTKMLSVVLAAIESESGEEIVAALKPNVLNIQRAVATIVQPFDVPRSHRDREASE